MRRFNRLRSVNSAARSASASYPVTPLMNRVDTITPGTGFWQAPANLVGTVKIEGWGHGGRGLTNATNSRGGGGGGSYARLDAFAATPGQSYAYVVGASGGAVATTFNETTLSAPQGSNSGATAAGGAGGAAGSAIGDAVFSGGVGGAGTAAGDNGGGGGGSATSTGDGTIGAAGAAGGAGGAGQGAGGQGGTVALPNGTAGVSPGGGGGGKNRGATANNEGGAGRLVLTYQTRG